MQQAFCQEKMSASSLEMGWNLIVKLYFVHIYEMLEFDIVIRLLIDGGKEAQAFRHHGAAPEPWSRTALSRALGTLGRQSKTQPAFSECIRKAGKISTNAVQACWINFAVLQPHWEMAEKPNAWIPLPAAVLCLPLLELKKHRFSATVRSWGSFQKDGTWAVTLSQVIFL